MQFYCVCVAFNWRWDAERSPSRRSAFISHTVIPAAATLYFCSLSAVWLPVYRRFGSDVKTEGMWQTWHVIFHSPMAACDIWRYYKVLSARLQWSVRTRSFSRCFTGRFRTCVSFQLDCEGWYRGILVYIVVLNDRCMHSVYRNKIGSLNGEQMETCGEVSCLSDVKKRYQ